jgi:hypothetical protein
VAAGGEHLGRKPVKVSAEDAAADEDEDKCAEDREYLAAPRLLRPR